MSYSLVMQSTESGEQPSFESTPVTPPRPKDDGPKIGSTPTKNHREVSSNLDTIPETLQSRYAAFHDEISGRVVGPVDVKLFNDFLPPGQPTGTAPDRTADCQELEAALKAAINESQMYSALVNYFKKLRPSENTINFCDKHNSVLKVFDDVDIKPDIVVFEGNDDATIEAMFEVKYSDLDDPFDDSVYGDQRESDRSRNTLGQITSYATYHQAMEFRTHAFSALIFRKSMRLLRWDRSGVVVTKRIPFADPSLFEFFHRFSVATTAERGRDPTVTAVDSPLDDMMKIRNSLGCKENARLLNIFVGDKKYIILKDQDLGSTSPIGRATRCFKTYCLENQELVLLKDSWRVVSPTLKPEHEIYERLHKRRVQNIPQVFHGADIGKEKDSYHVTQTRLWLDMQFPEQTLRTHRHYRIVLEYLPLRLEDFEVVEEMVSIVLDASIAHGDAAMKARVLHRDISNGNIMFKRKMDGTIQGYLIDWDLSLDLDLADEKAGEAQPERTGTWQFLAIRLVEWSKGGSVIQNRIDDVESFYHLMLWMALRYTAHALDPAYLTSLLQTNFDARCLDPKTGRSFLSSSRRSDMKSGDMMVEARFANAGIKSVLRAMRLTLRERYTDYAEEFGDFKDYAPWRRYAEANKVLALEALEDPQWLSKFLRQLLEDDEIDWKTDSGRVKHVLVKPSKYKSKVLKRKTESSLHSEGSRKASRRSGKSTPKDNRSDQS